MTFALSGMHYGFAGVRLFQLARRGDRHELHDLTVDLALEGNFTAIHAEGDNRALLPAESLRNALYALARDHGSGEIEEFGIALTQGFLEQVPEAAQVRVRIAQAPWSRIEIGGRPSNNSFARAGSERRITLVSRARTADTALVDSGIEGLLLLRTRPAGFAGFRKDRYTTLAESRDRLLGVELNALWRYGWAEIPYGVQWQQVRRVLLATFAEHDSQSVQHLLYAMARATLEQCPPIVQVRLRLPSRPPQPVDLTPFGMENTGEVFLPADDSHGEMEAVLRRDELA
jgi:urate oxidase